MSIDNQIHLGRDTEATEANWEAIAASMPVAPQLFMGERPRKTNNAKFLYPRYSGQLRGCCVGEAAAHAIEHLTRLPADKNPNSPPREGMAISPLATYLQARLYSRSRGLNLGGEGAIVSHCAEAISDADGGIVRYDYYPATTENYKQYSDNVRLSAKALEDKKTYIVREKALLTSFDAILDALASGRTVDVGTPIPSGMMNTSADGSFRWTGWGLTGRGVGGHSYLLVDYDLDADLMYVDNSWDNAGWGDVAGCKAGKYPRPLGKVRISEFYATFESRLLTNGTSEAVVFNDAGDWSTPKLIYDNSW